MSTRTATRALSRWMLSIGLTLVALVTINLLLVNAPTQARRAAALINCSGSIQVCINAANDGDTILIAAGRYTESLTLSKAVSLTGENRDTTIIHAVAYQRVLTVTGAAISNSVVISGLTFTGGEADYGGGLLITDTAQPLIRASIFISNMASIDGGGLYAQSDLTLVDSRIISNVAVSQGGGLYAPGPNLVLTNTDFIGNVGGGAIAGHWDHLSQVNVSAGGFISNDAGLSVYGSLHMSGTQILSNTGNAPLFGAGVGIFQGPATIVNSHFENNDCGSGCEAGGLSFYGGSVPSLVISNSVFIGNAPGGVYVHDYGQVTVTNSLFERNINTEDGGGMTLWQSSLTVTGSTFINNTGGTLGGGGIQILGEVTLINSHFGGNSSTFAGGGFYAMGNAYLTNTHFISNTADSEGGAAFVGGTAYMTDSRFERNTSGGGGGLSGGSFFITRTQFLSNTGTTVGGGIMAIGPLVANNSQFIGNQCLNVGCTGGGLYLLEYGGPGEFVNTVFARNQGHGAAMFVDAGNQVSLRHVTIADATSNVQPALVILSSTLNLTNTIIASHTIAISNTGGTVTEDYNLFFNNLTNTVGVTSGGHSLIGDPKFVDPLHGNYRLQIGSAAIDHGVDAGIYTDLDGNPRPFGPGFDIGAYEFTGGPRYVATTGSDTGNNCLNQASPCATVQHAIDVANDGEQVLIASGLYTQSATLYKPVSLTGVSSDTAILHAVAGQRVLTVTGATISHSVVISGLTFTGGKADYGGGLLITDTARPLIRDAIFVSNAAGVNGGGLYAQSDLTLMDSCIISNTAGAADGGLRALGANSLLINTNFIANTGGAIIGSEDEITHSVQVIGGQFDQNSVGGLLVYGSLEMTGTRIVSNTGASGVRVESGAARFVDTHFENNSCTADVGCYAGGLYFYSRWATQEVAQLTLSNTTFISNSPGGVFVLNSEQVSVVNGRFERNSTPNYGGGLWSYNSPVTMIATVVVSNTADEGGAGAMISGLTSVTDSRFEGNVSNGGYYAGGLYAYELRLTNTVFISNSSKHAGGVQAMYAYINGGRFERNTAQSTGGGLAVNNLFMTGTIVLSNTAGTGGGAWVPGTTRLNGVRFENNRALGDASWGSGGGLRAELDSLFISNSYFINNSAVSLGGGLFSYSDARGQVINTVFANNVSNAGGAAVAATAGGSLDLLHTTIVDTALNPQPALAVLSGTLHLTNTIIASHTIAISNTGGTVYEDYNLFFSNLTNTVGVTSGGHSLIGDPKFVDPLHGNYHLQSGSTAIDHGIDAGIYTDLDGNPRPFGVGFDIGAYEFATIMYRTYLPIVLK